MSWGERSGRVEYHRPEYIWAQVAADIRREIDSGALPVGAKLPGGPELAEIYGVAKATVARAIKALVEEGLVTVVFGRGTFVNRPEEAR